MVSQEAMRVLVMVNVEICNIPSDGSSMWGLETFKKLGALIPRRVEPNGPTISPVKSSARRIMVTQAKIFIEQPQPMFIALFQFLFFLLFFLFSVESAKHKIQAVKCNHCTYA